MEMVEFFNRIALLVASEILFEVDPMMRVRVISKVIQVCINTMLFRTHHRRPNSLCSFSNIERSVRTQIYFVSS